MVLNIARRLYHIFPQLLPSLIATLSAVSDGMQHGWSAPVFPRLRLEDSPIRVTHIDETWLEFIYLISAVLGVPMTAYLIEKIGRKSSILVASCITMTAWIIIAVADRVELLYLSRVLTGMASNTAYVSVPMYISELADQNIRGFLVGLHCLMMVVGILVIYSVAPFTPFYVPSLIGIAITVLLLTSLPFMPESPYYLLSKGKSEEARTALKRLRRQSSIDVEFEEIANAVGRQNNERGKFQDLFLVHSNRRAVLITTLLIFCQTFGGLYIMMMNMHTILSKSETIYMKSEDIGIVFSFLMVVAATICVLTVDKIGRKFLLVISGTLAGTFLLILSFYFTLKRHGINVKSLSWIPILSVMGFALTFKMGLGFLPQVIVSELFPTNVKTLGMTLGDAYLTSFGGLSVVFYQYVSHSHSFGIDIPLYFLAAVAFAGAIFTVLYVPETKGKTLEEIQLILKNGK